MNQFTIDDLADELIVEILNYLSLTDRIQCKILNRRWHWVITNLVVINSILVTSNRHKSILNANKLCTIRSHHFLNLLIVNPVSEHLDAIFNKDNHLERLRALKLDLDNQFELNKFNLNFILRLLSESSLVEHLELRIFKDQQFKQLSFIIDRLAHFNRNLQHISFKKIQFMDSFYLDSFDLFEQLFDELINLTVFECDFCIFNHHHSQVRIIHFSN